MEGSSAEKQGEEGQCVREELEKQQWWREREELCGAAKGITEDKGPIYRKKMMHSTIG
jgi:hypothetical protein